MTQTSAAPTPLEIATSETMMRGAVATIDRAASRIFREGGERYTSPRIVGYDGSVLTGCGRVNAYNAYACREDSSIYYDRAFIAYLMKSAASTNNSDGGIAVIFPIAHEWGHSLQYLLGLQYPNKAMSEQDADCLAGVLIAASRAGAPLSRNELADAEYTMQFLGDASMFTGDWGRAVDAINAQGGRRAPIANAVGVHGNSAERMRAFRTGLGANFRGCVSDIPRAAPSPASTPALPRPLASGPQSIHWFVDSTAEAYDLAVAQRRPIVLVTGDFNGVYFKRLKNEVLISSRLTQLAPFAVFAYADPSHDIVARNMARALSYDRYPTISLLAPNPSMIDEAFRIVGLFDAETVVAQLSKHLRSRGWMAAEGSPTTTNPPWMPPRPTPP
ncbi:MAG: neutral zinc metallopeptidase [Gemmatimonadota bacterium]|nr:neutral zinc metallopeptidase [Gemmatimonadota bacterium]